MERLTFEGNFCDIAQCRDSACRQYGTCTQKAVWKRLKAYEETGLTPAEVQSMSGEWCAMMSVLNSLGSHDRLRELAEADKDGRVVVLPCKVGDTVFARLYNKSKYVCECKVKQIVVGNIGFVTFAPIGAPEREYDVSLRGFGKTVFFSREEAEKALQKMEDKKDG
nr:MAG TPA: Small RNA degrading nuclease 1 Recognition Motif, RNA BINDING [Bacteriophage sp.]